MSGVRALSCPSGTVARSDASIVKRAHGPRRPIGVRPLAWLDGTTLAAVETFTVEATDGSARAGVLRTKHGDVPTPAFMPVGTKGTVKGVHPDELRGLHRFMGWDGPILTDSGGFQVFSLRDTIVRVDDDGVTFRSPYDGDPARLSPELAAEIQRRLGSDIAMCLDQVPAADVSGSELAEAVRRTTDWARRQRSLPAADGQLRFAISQGGTDPELRARSTEELVELDFDGNAVGGLAL